MHKIYFENRCIIICPEGDPALSDPNSIVYRCAGKPGIHELVGLFEASSSLPKVYIPGDEEVYHSLCAEFKEVNAAGGLVSNRRGDYLLIKRWERWDLPKGHQDPGEDISVTAMREVQEETGLGDLVLGGLICVTDHCYIRDGIWHLKHTWWYDMRYNEPVDFVPQREEDITVAAWVARSSLPPFLKSSFPSIVEVFHEAKV